MYSDNDRAVVRTQLVLEFSNEMVNSNKQISVQNGGH
jgi:hypothetical protein